MKKILSILLWVVCMTMCTAAASAASVVFVSGEGSDKNDGSASSPYASFSMAFTALGEDGGTVVLVGDKSVPAENKITPRGSVTLTSVYGDKDYGARLLCEGDLYLGGEFVFEHLTLSFAKSGSKIFCMGHDTVFGEGLTCVFTGSAPIIYGTTAMAKCKSLSAAAFYDFSVTIASGTWQYARLGGYRDSEGQYVGIIGGVTLNILGGDFTSTVQNVSGNGWISVTGMDALDGDGRICISGGNFKCGICGIGRPGYNSTVSNNFFGAGNIEIEISGGNFTAGRICAMQDTLASYLDGDFTLRVRGGSFANAFSGFDATGVRGLALPLAPADLRRSRSFTGFDDFLYVNGAAALEGDGFSPDTPKRSVSTDGGLLVLTGDTDASQIEVRGGKRTVITSAAGGQTFDGALAVRGTKTFGGDLCLERIKLSGDGVLSVGGHDLTVGEGVFGGAITLRGGEGDAFHKILIHSGNFAAVHGGASPEGCGVVLAGGSISGDIVGAAHTNGQILLLGGSVGGNLYALEGEGASAAIAVYGGSVGGKLYATKLAAASAAPAADAVDVFGVHAGEYTVDATGALFLYPDDDAVFVADGGDGDGGRPDAPLGSLTDAAATGKTVVFAGRVSAGGDVVLGGGDKTEITADLCGIDYTRLCGAVLALRGGLTFENEALLHDLSVVCEAQKTYFAAGGHPLTLGDGIDISLAPSRRIESYPTVTGGFYGQSAEGGDVRLCIKSGRYGVVCGGDFSTGESFAASRRRGSIALEVSGGVIEDALYLTGYESFEGDAAAMLCGGVFDCSVYAMPHAGQSVCGDLALDIVGGQYRGDIANAPVQPTAPTATLDGEIKIRIFGGDFARVGMLRKTELCGENQSDLYIGDGIDLEAPVEGRADYQNPIAGYADPSVVYTGEFYYYTYSKSYAGSFGLYMAKAANLCDIGNVEPQLIWSQALTGQGSEMTALWAPQLYYLDGRWYIYAAGQTTADAETGSDRRDPYVWVGQTDTPEGPYTYHGVIDNLDRDVFSYLSPRLITHGGKLYMFCSGFYNAADANTAGGVHIQRMRVCEMADPLTMATKQIVISTPTHTWEGCTVEGEPNKGIMEGPFPFYTGDGTLWLIYAAGHTRTDEYCTGLMRFTGGENDSLLDASLWYKYDTPLQFVDYSTGVYSPGAMIVTTSPNGDFYGVFHAKVYHYSAYTMRRMYMQKIEIVDGKPQMTAAQSADTTYSIELNPLPLSARIDGYTAGELDGAALPRPRLRRDIRLRPAFPQMDINGDGKLSLADVLRAMKFAVGGDFDEDDEIFADVNADGKNSLADVLLVLEKLL